MRKSFALALIQLGFLAACGGGGYSGGMTTPPPTQTIATPGPPNVETVTVDAGPPFATFTAVNTPFISVKVCVPGTGTTTCQTIDHIEVDTGSIGLRILADAPLTVALPVATDAVGNPMAECLEFADGTSFGSLAVADIQLPVSGETATGVTVQIIGDTTYPTIPSDCGPGTPTENTVAAFGANGILGVGPFIDDCNSTGSCPIPTPGNPQGVIYYSCPTPGACVDATASVMEQLPNPVILFGTDNNGVIVELPAVGSSGTTTVSGSLVFGIGTRTNNALGTATVLPLIATSTGDFITATYKGTAYADGYIDSGSNGNFFTDSSLVPCTTATGFYCPTSTMSETATLQGTSTTMLAADFSVANAETLFSNTSYTAFSNLGGTNPDAMGFDLGLPFFYGHNVFTAIENANTAGGMGPYFAY